MEDIKDGQATTSKYDNDNIQFKTPNTVMVFSNNYPDLKKLTKDCWLVLHPNNNTLKEVTTRIQKIQEKKCVKDFDVNDFPQIMKGKSGDASHFETDEIDQESDNSMPDI